MEAAQMTKPELLDRLYQIEHRLERKDDREVIEYTRELISSAYRLDHKDTDSLYKVGQHVVVCTDDIRMPKGTECVVMEIVKTTYKPYYIRNVNSEYCCWANVQDLQSL